MAPEQATVGAYGRFRDGVLGFHRWHGELSILQQAMLILGWACVMGALAQLAIPRHPVPFTMQTFGVLLGAVLLGARNGALAQVVYVGAGVAGVPWFAGFASGWAVFTAGFLIAFPVAAIFVGLAVHALRIRTYWGLVGTMTIGAATILFGGWLWLAFVVGLGAQAAFVTQIILFVPVDVVKVFLAAAIAVPFLPHPAPSQAPPLA